MRLLYRLCVMVCAVVAWHLPVAGEEQFTGWRMDGTGHFKQASPPLKWSRQAVDGKPESSGLLWMTPIPSGASSPIVVGDRIFFGYGQHGLLCVNKSDGRILWHRNHSYFDLLSDEQRKGTDEKVRAAYEKLKAHHAAELKRMSEAVSAAGWPDTQRFMTWAWGMQVDEQRKLVEAATLELDRERYRNSKVDWEFSSATPASDSKFVYMWYSHRVAVCYDLDGNLKWATLEPARDKGASEHGRHSSPLLAGDKLLVQYGRELIAFDRNTGKLAWSKSMMKSQATPAYGSPVRMDVAGQAYAVTCTGEAFRVADGEQGWERLSVFAGENTSACVSDGRIFIWDRAGLFQLQPPAAPGPGAKPVIGKSLKFESVFKNYMIASPLVVDGLVYAASDKGLLRVFDAESGEVVYEQQLPLKPHVEYVHFPGLSASPAYAGGKIFITDNQGGTAIIEPGRAYKEVAVNQLATLEKKGKAKDGKELRVNEQTLGNLWFDGKLLFVRGQQYLYCIGTR